MKKIQFYSMTYIAENKSHIAELRNGYTDGTYYYYTPFRGLWHAIHPACGLSVASSNTRQNAAAEAHTKERGATVERVMQERGETLASNYRNAIARAQAEQ